MSAANNTPPGSLGQRLTVSDYAPEVVGPNLRALFEGFEAVAARLVNFPAELFAALDLRPAVWDPTRPAYHLPLQCKYYGVEFVAALSPAAMYRRVRMTDISRHTNGQWPGLLRWAAAAASCDNVSVTVDTAEHRAATPEESTRVTVHLGPLVAVVFFREDYSPGLSEVTAYKDLWVTAIQDVAGWGLLVGPENCFKLDVSPGLDVKPLCKPL